MDKQSFELQLKPHSKIKKDSTQKVIELQYDHSQQLISCLSGDNKIEYFRVIVDNQEAILKKMIRTQKRQNLKRKKVGGQDEDDSGDEKPTEQKVDKNALKEKIEAGDYDLSMHLSKKSVIDIEQTQKVRSLVNVFAANKKKSLQVLVSCASTNQIYKYSLNLKSEVDPCYKLEN